MQTLIDCGRAPQHLFLLRNKPDLRQHIIQIESVFFQCFRNGIPGCNGNALPRKRLYQTGCFLSETTVAIVNEKRKFEHYGLGYCVFRVTYFKFKNASRITQNVIKRNEVKASKS